MLVLILPEPLICGTNYWTVFNLPASVYICSYTCTSGFYLGSLHIGMSYIVLGHILNFLIQVIGKTKATIVYKWSLEDLQAALKDFHVKK